MQALGPLMPELVGGTADLNPSTLAWVKGAGDFQAPGTLPPEGIEGSVGGPWGYEGRNIHYGVREHAMGAIAAGCALHGGIIPYTGTFLTFSDYMRPSIRLAALMGIRDSLCLFPRQYRRWRRRPNSPAGRTDYEPQVCAQSYRHSPCRRQ